MSGHCGGVGPLQNEKISCTRSKSHECTIIDHSRNFFPHQSEEDDGDRLDRLAPYVGTAWDEQPQGVSSGSGWREITMKTKPLEGRQDQSQTTQAQPSEKKKWRYTGRLLRTNSLKEGAM
jgi:hypothetical protein